ncbi:MAG: MFS transporter [Gemmataceae bacterium]|nr:MFS transporter [Gemmataceae bacterium]
MNQDIAAPPAVEAPTRVRYGVLGFACSLSMITYLDRVCFGQAVTPIMAALELNSEADISLAFTAFAFSYAIFEIPTGWLGDVFGPRKTMIRIVLWWSFFTVLTGLVGKSIGPIFLGTGALITIRFLFGIGEAGAYPNITRALHNWLPFGERGFGQGAVWFAGRLMGGLTPVVWWVVVLHWGMDWREAFYFFGALGIAWCIVFALWFRNRPEEKSTVNDAELRLITAGRSDHEAGHAHVPWLKLLRSTNLWMLCLMYFCAAYGWYFNITYLPRFMEQQFQMDVKDVVGRVLMGGPLWLGAVGCLAGGLMTDWFIRRTGNRKWGRRLFGIVGHSVCAVCYFLAIFTTDSIWLFFVAISLAAFWNDLTMGSAWSVCQDIGRNYAAIVAGAMNTIGNLGGAMAGWLTGRILNASLAAHAASEGLAPDQLDAAQKRIGLLPGYEASFISFAVVYVIAALLWLRIDATKPVVPDEDKGAVAA